MEIDFSPVQSCYDAYLDQLDAKVKVSS